MLNRPIRYFNTNEAIFGSDGLEEKIVMNKVKSVGLAEAIIIGQAPDGGLFMPTHFPQISLDEINGMKDMTYSRIFTTVMKGFFKGVLSDKTLERIAEEAYTFEPYLEHISKDDIIARLDEGPTAAFKDYAAQVLFRVVEALIKEKPENEVEFRQKLKDIDLLTYIVATSGDTGGAMGKAIHGRSGVWMPILHSADVPGEISELQAKQMDTLGENVYVLRIKTDFDGCQSIAQDLQKDPELEYMNPTSANSINIGRLIPQVAYYFHIYSKVADSGEEVYFSVPSGNFGDAVAGFFAKKMGLPIKLIIGVNENDVFERFYRTGIYAPAEKTVQCSSNAMNVTWPSNIRRFVQLYGGQIIDGEDPHTKEKVIQKFILPNLKQIRKDAKAYSITNKEVDTIIKEFYDKGYEIDGLHSTLEPHGAVGWGATQKFRKENGYDVKVVTLETAHSAKFPERLRKFGIEPELPKCLSELIDKSHGDFIELENDYNAVKKAIVALYQKELKRCALNK